MNPKKYMGKYSIHDVMFQCHGKCSMPLWYCNWYLHGCLRASVALLFRAVSGLDDRRSSIDILHNKNHVLEPQGHGEFLAYHGKSLIKHDVHQLLEAPKDMDDNKNEHAENMPDHPKPEALCRHNTQSHRSRTKGTEKHIKKKIVRTTKCQVQTTP